MATALRFLRVGESATGYVLPFAQIRSGLLTAEHCERMGEAIWLYLWLHSRAHLRTGVITGYTHDEPASVLGQSRATIRRWFKRLEDGEYVESARRRYGLDLRITKYGDALTQNAADPECSDLSTLKNPECSDLQPRVLGSDRKSAQIRALNDLEREQRDQKATTDVVARVRVPENLAGFDRALRDAPGYKPTASFFEKVGKSEYAALDLEEEAVMMAGWLGTKRGRQASSAFILGWLRRSADKHKNGGGYGSSKNGAHAAGGRALDKNARPDQSARDAIRAARTGAPVLH